MGGEPAPPDRWPWMAALVSSGGDAFDGQFCGATVIGRRRVLTAAHCVYGERGSAIGVVVGRSRLTQSGGRTLPVTGISVFKGYARRSPGLDAAVVTVGKDLGVPAVPLAADLGGLADGVTTWSLGWGRLDAKRSAGGGSYTADRLRQVSLPLVGDDACERAYGAGGSGLTYRPGWELCAGPGDGSTGTCYGDSGGPLVVASPAGWTQIGIVQSGDGCASKGFFDLFTRVDRIRSFALRARLTLQPEALTPPRIRGRFRARHVLTCVPARFAGSPAHLTAAWVWLTPDDEEDVTRVVGTSWTHRVTREDRRHRLSCDVIAANDGGTFDAMARPLVP